MLPVTATAVTVTGSTTADGGIDAFGNAFTVTSSSAAGHAFTVATSADSFDGNLLRVQLPATSAVGATPLLLRAAAADVFKVGTQSSVVLLWQRHD